MPILGMAMDDVRHGQRDAEARWRDHQDAIRSYMRRRVPWPDAEDLTSEVFIAAGEADVANDELMDLYRIAYRLVRRYRSDGRRHRALLDRLLRQNPTPPTMDDSAAVGVWIQELIDRLAGFDRELLRLIVFDDLTITAAARVIGISPGAAHTRLHRIRNRLQRWVAADEPQ